MMGHAECATCELGGVADSSFGQWLICPQVAVMNRRDLQQALRLQS